MVKKASFNGPNRAKIKQSQGITIDEDKIDQNIETKVTFRIRAMERLDFQDNLNSSVCLVSSNGSAVKKLLDIHKDLLLNSQIEHTKCVMDEISSKPILIHFHEFPVFVLRVQICEHLSDMEEDVMYLHKVQRFNSKVCGMLTS